MKEPSPEALKALAEKWKTIARHKFEDAEKEPNDIGRRLIEHGAMCYFNCYAELMQELGVDVAPNSQFKRG